MQLPLVSTVNSNTNASVNSGGNAAISFCSEDTDSSFMSLTRHGIPVIKSNSEHVGPAMNRTISEAKGKVKMKGRIFSRPPDTLDSDKDFKISISGDQFMNSLKIEWDVIKKTETKSKSTDDKMTLSSQDIMLVENVVDKTVTILSKEHKGCDTLSLPTSSATTSNDQLDSIIKDCLRKILKSNESKYLACSHYLEDNPVSLTTTLESSEFSCAKNG